MLWVYAENDHFFAPRLAEKLRSAFIAGGGKVEFIHALAFRKDGHTLFSLRGIPRWTPYVDEFLGKQNLALVAAPMPLPQLPELTSPPQLSSRGREAFGMYLRGGAHKAFAVSGDGHFGWQTGKRTIDEAKRAALKFCRGGAKDCHIVLIDDSAVR